MSVWPLSIIEQLFQEHNLERPEPVLPRCHFSHVPGKVALHEAILCHFFILQAHDAGSWDSAPSDTPLPTHMLSHLKASQAWNRDHFKRDRPVCCRLEPTGVFRGRAVGLSQSISLHCWLFLWKEESCRSELHPAAITRTWHRAQWSHQSTWIPKPRALYKNWELDS